MFQIFIKISLLFFVLFGQSIKAAQSLERAIADYQIRINDISDYKDFQELVVLKTKVIFNSHDEIKIKLYIAQQNVIFYLTKTNHGVFLEQTNESFDLENKHFEGVVTHTLLHSVLRDTKNLELATLIDNAFKKEFSTTKKLKVKAFYRFEVEAIVEDGEVTDYGQITTAKLTVGRASVEKSALFDLETETSTLVNFTPTSTEKIFTSPVASHRVSSLFNLHRKHPVTRRIQPHNGIDFVAKSGTPVFPAADGEVVAMGRTKAKGKYILIDHGNGFQSTYDHLRKFESWIRIGTAVSTKDQIAEVGKTGYATGAHLHFGLMKNGLYVNPLHYFIDLDSVPNESNEIFHNNEELLPQLEIITELFSQDQIA